MLKVFSCPTYYLVNDGKIKPRAKKRVHVAKTWSPSEQILILSINVTFDESSSLKYK